MNKKPVLVALLLTLPVGLVAFAWLAGGEVARPVLPPAQPLRAETPAEAPAVELIPPPVVRLPSGEVSSTVLWPVKFELELVEPRFLPKKEGVQPIGSGAGARLSGQITGFDDSGVQAEIRFVAGANTGRILRSDETGRFGAVDLYPGLSIVEVRGTGTLGSRRELRLRRGQETLLNIGYGRPGVVFGRVQDSGGAGLAGARVTVDGTSVTTDAEGGFYVAQVASGQVMCQVELDGYALYQELMWIAGGGVTPQERMTFTLKPAAEMRVAIRGNAGGPGPVLLYLFSERQEYSANSAYRNESFPWHEINPVEAWPGQPVTIGRLRPEIVRVHAFRTGARAPVRAINLASSLRDVVIELEPAPILTGRVLQDGEPVLGARVRLEAPDRVRATLGYFSEPSYYLETAVMPQLPPGLQEVVTGEDGRFVLSAWADTSPVRFLEARGPGGDSWTGRFVSEKDQEVALELQAIDVGASTLLVRFPGRHQGLPVEVWLGGSPRTVQILAADADLEIGNLVAGRWRVRASWRSHPIHSDEELEIDDVERLEVQLPPECIEGQNEEQWKRAGREYPHGS